MLKNINKEMKMSKFKEYGRGQRAKYFWQSHRELTKFFVTEGHRYRNEFNEFSKLLNDVKNSEAILLISKENKEGEEHGFVVEFASVLTEVANNIIYGRAEPIKKMTDEEQAAVLENYRRAIYRILKPRVVDFVTETKVESKALAMELLSIVPVPQIIQRKNLTGIYVNKIINRLYALAGTKAYVELDGDDVKEIFKFLIGKSKLPEVAVSVLLSGSGRINNRANDNDDKSKMVKATYDAIMEFALTTLNKLDKEELQLELDNFAKRRKRDMEKNRISKCMLSDADLSEYKRLSKQIKKYLKKSPKAVEQKIFE